MLLEANPSLTSMSTFAARSWEQADYATVKPPSTRTP
jgi:hypothetical protein